MKRFCLLIVAAFLSLHAPAQDSFLAAGQNHTRAQLIFSADAAKPGQTIWAAVKLDMDPHWHTYWRFGGDAGIATSIAWTLPGVTAGDIHWPVPKKSETKAGDTSLFTYEYHDTVLLLIPMKLDPALPAGPIHLTAALKWLECEEKGLCVPASSDAVGALTVGPQHIPSPKPPCLNNGAHASLAWTPPSKPRRVGRACHRATAAIL